MNWMLIAEHVAEWIHRGGDSSDWYQVIIMTGKLPRLSSEEWDVFTKIVCHETIESARGLTALDLMNSYGLQSR
jgi:hypothetical protein